MTVVTPGIVPASALTDAGPPSWLAAWGAFAARTRFEDLPPEVVGRCKLVLLDTIGAVAAGMQEAELRALVARLAGYGVEGDTPAIGAGRRLPAPSAALANGAAGTVLELDEGNQYARGHPAIHVVPAALATAGRLGAAGRDLLLAVALGYEMGARIGIASKLRPTMHPHGTWGTVGAALAVAKLHGAGAGGLVEAVNLSSCLGLTTSRRTMLEGGTVRNAYAGLSNQLGMLAWDLVAAGFTGERDGVGTVYGSVVADRFEPEAMDADLGGRWEIARNYFKRHAACRYTHAALDALAEIVAQAGGRLDPEQIRGIEVDTYVWAAQLDLAEPPNMLAAKFSLPFALATAVVHGRADVDAFRDPARTDPVIRALARRVTVREDPVLTALLPRLRPARLRVALADGRVLAAEAMVNKGDAEDPYGPDDIGRKFLELAGPVWGEGHARRVAQAVDGLDGAADVRALDGLLAAPPRVEEGA